ncbi:hypothetical protein BpHYR1_012639 [Brachionus plicatilis]|uniref:Uncharacterized protein n=1 Tax=Brachionus plicatilis TaxID=10195 RepID=A0A3M7SUS1_BRAPC|nr:hypothetical protein BpHYR1_012639 [Brachionus plicatilis]
MKYVSVKIFKVEVVDNQNTNGISQNLFSFQILYLIQNIFSASNQLMGHEIDFLLFFLFARFF